MKNKELENQINSLTQYEEDLMSELRKIRRDIVKLKGQRETPEHLINSFIQYTDGEFDIIMYIRSVFPHRIEKGEFVAQGPTVSLSLDGKGGVIESCETFALYGEDDYKVVDKKDYEGFLKEVVKRVMSSIK